MNCSKRSIYSDRQRAIVSYSILCIVVAFAGCSTPVFAQESGTTLEAAIALALERNPSIQVSTLETTRQETLNRASIDIPKTEVSLLYGQYNSIEKRDNNITVSQSIPFPSVFSRQLSLNRAMTEASRYRENISRNDLVFSVREVFNQLLYLKARHRILQQQDSLLGDLAKVAALHYKTGEGTLLAKTSAETQWHELQNQYSRNEADIHIALNRLQLLCQAPAITAIAGDLETSFTALSLDSVSVEQNPSLLYTRQQIEVAQLQKKLETARALPELRLGYFNQTLIGLQTVQGQEQYFGPSKRFQGFQAGIAIPLWYAPHASRIRAASLATDVARKQEETYILALTQQYNQAYQELQKNRNSLEYYRSSALKTADLLTHQSRVAFKSGELDYATLLLNLRQALSIHEGYLSALQQYNQSIIFIHYLNGNKP
ncbi:TolC family protein [Ohtaekwangia sp.]|uniref:TolC family protein n=1 Tax=Ohtaekwangia sp. TaxID=2066019 RepID=UPI002FDCC762